MTSADAYEALLHHLKGTAALGQVSGLLGWDQEVMMPPHGGDSRSEQVGVLEEVLHARRTDPRIAEWLAQIDPTKLDDVGRANLREARRTYDRAIKVPTALAAEIARTTAKAHLIWIEARKAASYADFAPTLERVLALCRERASCLRCDKESLYDALLEDYEPGATEASLAETFANLRAGLTELRAAIAASGRESPILKGSFRADKQLALARELASTCGYDWQAGRLDLAVHPFSSGTRGDARITTRADAANPFDCLYSTIHETGHAVYEQGLDPALAWQPAGNSVSMGVHESQSRLFENQIGRSAAFCEYLFPKMVDAFGDIGLGSPRDLYRAANLVIPGFIRTEADEVHYNLQIMLRFDLERALISGDLGTGDLEAAWNDRFAADFGRMVPDAAMGVLQDVHWSVGLFGYFPTYTLGNVYAGHLMRALRQDLPDMDNLIRTGDLTPIIDWLRQKIHRQGSLRRPRELISQACGAEPDENALLGYLKEKFGELYGL